MPIPPRNNLKERSSLERQTRPPESQTQSHDDIPSSSSSSSAADNFSSPSMKPIDFPPGYKFLPTDEDLLFHYLKPFSNGNRKLHPSVPIHRANIYESNPDQLTKKFEKGNVKEWFFITERTKVHEGGKRHIRRDNGGGYWKATTVSTKIEAEEGVVGYKTKLEYVIGKKANGVKSNWLMQEYWFQSNGDVKSKVDHVLCKIYLTQRASKRKSGEEENDKKKKKTEKESGVATVDVEEALEEEVCNIAFQPQQSQLCVQELQKQFFVSSEMNSDDSENNFGDFNLPDDFELYLCDFNPLQLDRDEESTTFISEANEEKLH